MTPMPTYDRLPPHDTDIEEALLAALMVDAPDTAEVVSTLKPDAFFRQQNQWVFSACADLWARGMVVNQLTVARELSMRGLLEDVGGQAFLSDVVRNGAVMGTVLAKSYADIVRNLANRRALLGVGHAIEQLAHDDKEPDFGAIRDRAMSLLLEVGGESSDGNETQTARELLDGGLRDKIEDDILDPHRTIGWTTGIAGIDRLTRGFQGSKTYYIAAETSIGKSLLVQDIVVRIAGAGGNVVMFTTEMAALEVGERMIFMLAGLDPITPRMREGGAWTAEEEQRIREAAEDFGRLPVRFCDRQDVSYGYLRSEVLRQRARGGVDMIVVDHIQAMEAGDHNNRLAQELESIARGLKMLSREFDVPVMVVSQLSRASNGSAANMLSRLRNSAGIEQYADCVAFLLPFEMQNGSKSYLELDEARARSSNPGWTPVEFNVLKHRGGPTGPVWLLNDWRAGGRYYDYNGGAE